MKQSHVRMNQTDFSEKFMLIKFFLSCGLIIHTCTFLEISMVVWLSTFHCGILEEAHNSNIKSTNIGQKKCKPNFQNDFLYLGALICEKEENVWNFSSKITLLYFPRIVLY